MGVVGLVALILVVGVLMWAVNTFAAPYIAAPFLKLANAVAIIFCVIVVLLWVLALLGVSTAELGRWPFR